MAGSCERDLSVQGYVECSGNGVCDGVRCRCNYGWSGISDFSDVGGYDCDVNLSYVLIMSVLIALVSFICFLYIPTIIFREQTWKTNKRFGYKNICYISFFICNVSGMSNISRFINPTQYILGSKTVDSCFLTAMYVLSILSYTIGQAAYISCLNSFIRGFCKAIPNLGHRELVFSMVNANLKLAKKLVIAHSIILTTAIALVTILQQSFKMQLLISYFVAMLITYASSVMYVNRSFVIFFSEVRAYIERTNARSEGHSMFIASFQGHHSTSEIVSKDTTNLLNRVSVACRFSLTVYSVGIAITLLFLSWPKILRKAVYFNLFHTLSLSSMTCVMTWSISQSFSRENSYISKARDLLVLPLSSMRWKSRVLPVDSRESNALSTSINYSTPNRLNR